VKSLLPLLALLLACVPAMGRQDSDLDELRKMLGEEKPQRGTERSSGEHPRPQEPEDGTEEYDLDADAEVAVQIVTGSIRVTTRKGSKAKLTVEKTGPGREEIEVKVDASAKRLHVGTKYPEDWWRRRENGQGESTRVDVKLELPERVGSVELTTVVGEIDAEGIEASNAKFVSTTGQVGLAHIRADVQVTTVNGALRLRGVVSQRTTLTTVNGSVTGAVRARTLIASSVNGEVSLQALPPREGEWSVKGSSVSGSLTLTLPRDCGARLDVTGGDIECEFELRNRRERKNFLNRSLHGSFGDGAGSVSLTTLNAQVRVKRGD